MLRRSLSLVAFTCAVLSLSAGAFAQSDGGDPGPVVVAEVSGPLDQRMLDFMTETIVGSPAQLVVFQIDSPGISSGDPGPLLAAIDGADMPIGAWVGPAPAVAFGGAGLLLNRVDLPGAAPDTEVGRLAPLVVGDDLPIELRLEGETLLESERFVSGPVGVTEPIPGMVDFVEPSIGQYLAALDGATVLTATGRSVVLETAQTTTLEDGSTITTPSVEVRFTKPGLFTRFLRLASRPEATLFYLLAGLSAAAFEFYAAGVGITAAVAALALFLAGYGLATLPINWAAFAVVLVGLLLYTIDFQRNELGLRSIAGTAMLLGGGLTLTTAGPQFVPRWWAVVLTVAGIAAFYGFALTTVVRSRFSTQTIGREHLVGRRGVAETGFDPEGIVTVDGARWRARSHRAAGLGPGDPVEVTAINGIVLEVGPPE